jgi:protein-histidine pros-kinase
MNAYRVGMRTGDVEGEVTALRAEVAQLRKTNDLQTELLGMVAHELVKPISVISGFSYTLHREDRLTPEQRKSGIEIMGRQVAYMSELIEDLLQTSRILYPTGTMTTLVAPAVEQALAQVTDVFGATDIHVEPGVGDAEVLVDPQALRLILTNLVGNAVKYATSGPIRITSSVDEDVVRVAVSNPGPEIPPEERAHIFEPFKRSSTVGSVEGSGLGLHIVKRFAEANGGSVDVDCSDGVVIFTVTLPRASR